jgi:LysM repeat protein
MDLKRLEQILAEHTTAGVLTLPPAALESPDVLALLERDYNGQDLVLAIAEQVLQGEVIQMKGTLPRGSFPLLVDPTVAVAARAYFYLVGGVAQLLVEATLPDGYVFADSFPVVADTVVDALELSSAALQLRSLAPTPDGLAPGVPRGLSFAGVLHKTGPLEPMLPLLGTSAALALSGVIELLATARHGKVPLFALDAPTTGGALLGPYPIDPRVVVTSDYDDDPRSPESVVPFTTAVNLVTALSAGAASVPLSMVLFAESAGLYEFNLAVEKVWLPSGLSDLSQLVAGVDLAALVPVGYPLGNAFYLTQLDFMVEADTAKLSTFGIGVQLDTSWRIIPNVITVEAVALAYTVLEPLAPTLAGMRLDVTGVFDVAGFRLQVTLALPELNFMAELDDQTPIEANAILHKFLGSGVSLPSGVDLTVYALEVQANPRSQYYSVAATVGQDEIWSVNLIVTTLTLRSISIQVDYEPNSLTGEVVGEIAIFGTIFEVSASKLEEPDAWEFAARMQAGQSLSLTELIASFLPQSVKLPDFVPNLAVGGIALTYATVPPTFSIEGGTAEPWVLELGGNTFALSAFARFERKKPSSGPTYEASLSGTLQVNNLSLSVTYEFTPDNQTLTLEMAYRRATLTGVLTRGKDIDTVLKVRVGNVSVGEILEYLVNLASPGTVFVLPKPFDLLNRISLDGLSLMINFTKRQVGIEYPINLKLGFFRLEVLTLTYLTRNGRGTVELGIVGSFGNQDYPPGEPLRWDTLNDPPPSVPGEGGSFFDLYYLGMGQRVALESTASIRNVQQAIEALQNTVVPVKDPAANPVAQTPGLRFNADSNWLFGAQFQLMNTFAMSVVFNDPQLYGLRISLSGEKAGSLAGLAFEILYRKVTDDIGVYHIELQLPDAMRQLEFGAVSVTLPVVVLDIYTNGNFRVDFGFPHNRDFSRSAGVQVFPFTGAGGFYLAVLDGNTSERVPRITNGTFKPVIEFGLGLRVGVGKTIDKGVLKAGIEVSLEAIIEGVLAWFNPDDKAVASARYYYIEGTAALIGRLYGEVNFAIISASLTVTVSARLTFRIEAYEPIFVELEVYVAVSASVKVLFIRISFSFKLRLNVSFTIGSRTTPPWRVAEGPQPAVLRGARPRHAPLPPAFRTSQAARQLELARARGGGAWTPVNVFDGAIHNLLTWVLPGFTVAGTAPSNTEVMLVLSLFLPNNIAAGAHASAAVLTAADPDGQTPFNLLLEALLAWGLQSMLGRLDGRVTAEQLQDLLADLSRPETQATAFDYDNLSQFLALNFTFWLTGQNAGGSDERNATVFPVAPALAFHTSTGVDRNFGEFNPVGAAYVQRLAAYFRQTQVDVEADVAPDPLAVEAATRGAPKPFRASGGAATESFATVIFRDAFVMLAKSAVQSAVTLLERYPHRFAADDTLGAVAVRYGLTPGEIARANPALALDPDADITLSGLTWQARDGQTLQQIADQFDLETDALVELPGNCTASELLRTGATLAVYNQEAGGTRSIAYTSQPGDSLAFIAAFFLMRNTPEAGPQLTYLSWYEQTVASLNPLVNFAEPLAVGTLLTIPVAEVTDQGIAPTEATLRYATRKADTVTTIGAAFDAVQVEPWVLAEFEAELRTLNPAVNWNALQPGTALNIPALARVVQATDSFEHVAELFGVTPAQLGDANRDDAGVLAPLAVWRIPAFAPTVTDGSSLESVAQSLDLTIEAVADELAGVAGLFPAGTELILADLPDFAVKPLLEQVRTSGEANQAATQMSRFLLNGLRPLTPDAPAMRMSLDEVYAGAAADSDTAALYALTGQQFAAPASPTADLQITLRNAAAVDWLRFATVITSAAGDTLDGLAARYRVAPAVLVELNPGVTWNPLAQGTALHVPGDADLVVELTAQQLADNAPSTTFAPQMTENPTALPVREDVPVQYGLTTGMVWQAAAPIPFACTGTAPEQQAGQPSLWYFPDNLLSRVAASPDGTPPYQLMVAVEQTGAPTDPREVACYDWACAVQVSVRRIPSGTSALLLPSSYLMLGADEGGRELLLSVWEFLDPDAHPEGADLFLLYSPTPGMPPGLASDGVDTGLTSILKTNLSTVTHSGPQARDPSAPGPASGDYYANLLAAREFVRLVWEISAVGTGGFYLNYYTASGAGLPDNLFTEGNIATLLLVVVPRAQSRAESPDRRLYPFNNCALLDENIDLSRMTLFTWAADQSETTAAATLPPGAVGFRASRPNPELEPPSPEQRTRSLYSLLSFQAQSDAFFHKSNQGLPPGPMEEAPDPATLRRTPSRAVTNPDVWQFQQVLPASRLGRTNPVPDAPALPRRADNPYAGIRYEPISQRLSALTLAFDFQDVYGNRVPPDVALPDLSLLVGYTDQIVGLSSWPGVTATYLFTRGASGRPTLDVNANLDVLQYVPFPGNGVVNAVQSASAHATRFQQAYYQVFSDDAVFRLRTSVDQASLAPDSAGYPVDRVLLRRFVGASYVFLTTATWQEAYEHTTTPGQDLADVIQAFATTDGALGELNAQSFAAVVFTGPVAIPRFQVVPAGFTLKRLSDASGLGAAALVERNADAPLQPGTDLTTKPRTHTAATSDLSLAQIAEALNATPGRIGDVNADDRTVLAPGKPFAFQGTTLTTVAGESLDDLVARFEAIDLEPTVAELVVANETLPGMFRKGAVLTVDDHVVQAGDSFATLAAMGFGSPAELAERNTPAPPDVFITGTPLRLEDTLLVPGPDDTLAQLAQAYGITLAQLVNANARTALCDGAGILIPDQVRWSPARLPALFVPFQAPAGVSLGAAAGRFGVTALAFAEPNRALAVFAADQAITISGQTVTTVAGESMDDVLARFAALGVTATLADLVTAIAARDGMFLPDALFTAPLVPGSDRSLGELGADYHVDPVQLAQVNRALRGFLRPGAEVVAHDAQGQPRTLVVTENDTFNTLVVRFARELDVITTVPALVLANRDTRALIDLGARFTLPPRPVQITAPDVTPDYPSTIFAITVMLEQARDAQRVDPAFHGVPGVATETSAIAPRALPNVDGDLALTEFAIAFEAAFPPTLKVATGDRPTEQPGDTPAPASVYAVRFDAGGISRFLVERDRPEFYALAPLSTELVSRPRVSIQKYVSGVGLVPETMNQDFQAVDLDAWMQQFLSASDEFLSAPFAVPAWFLEPDHASFEQAVKAKGDVATLLAGQVRLVVQSAGGSPAAAAEALRQQMLVQLSSAYEVSSILQYPVDVGSPYLDPATAPRLSGKPTLNLRVTGATDTLTTLAMAYQVSQLVVTQMLADARELLNTGVTVHFETQSHVLTPGDTLLRLTEVFDTTLEGLAYGLSVPAGQGLFKPGAVLNFISAARAVAAGDAFDQLAEFFNATVERVADNVRDLPDLLRTGAVVIYEGERVTVKAGQTLADVAGEFPGAPPPAQVAASAGVRRDPALLNPGKVVHLLAALPDASLSTSKVALNNGPATANFLLTVKSPADARRLFLDLDYVINELEHEVGQQGSLEGYQSSSWLSFVLPLGEEGREPAGVDTDIGQVVVPVPLRAYPTPPSLKGQNAVASAPESRSLEDTLAWDYTFDFESQTSDQDALLVEVLFNLRAEDPALARPAGEDLFHSLAQFIAVYPQVQEDLARLPALTPGEPDPTALGAVQAMAELMARVGQHVSPAAQRTRAEPTALRFEYHLVDTRTADVPPQLETLTLTALKVPVGYEGQWPELRVSSSGPAFVPMEKTASDASKAIYRYPAGIPSGQPLTLRFVYPRRDLNVIENGTAGISLRRNDGLLIDRPTEPGFIYQTPTASFSNLAVPLNAFTTAFDINLAGDLEASLTALFATLLGDHPEGRTVKTACYYGYQLAQPATATDDQVRALASSRAGRPLPEIDTWLVSLLPVFLRPNTSFSSHYVQELVAAIAAWRDRNPASQQGGMFVFDVSTFSGLDLATPQPLLQLTRLVYLGLV